MPRRNSTVQPVVRGRLDTVTTERTHVRFLTEYEIIEAEKLGILRCANCSLCKTILHTGLHRTEIAARYAGRPFCSPCAAKHLTGVSMSIPTRKVEDMVTIADIVTLPPLYKAVDNGIMCWKIRVDPVDPDYGRVTVEFGLIGGQKQILEDVVREGKNAGTKAATNGYTQALREAQAEWAKKVKRKGYSEDMTGEESAIKRALLPMKAETYELGTKRVEWERAMAQPKLDGYRSLIRNINGRIFFRSREGLDLITAPHIIDAVKGFLQPGEAFDGELYKHGWTLERISSAAKKLNTDSPLLELHVYDSPGVSGRFEQRHSWIQQKCAQLRGSPIHLVPTIEVASETTLLHYQEDCIAQGFEGAMLRHGPKAYEPDKRSTSLLKVKTFVDAEFKIIGCKQAKYDQAVFICQTKDGNEFDCFAPGTILQKQKAWLQREQWIGKQMTIKYPRYTNTEKPVPYTPIAKGPPDGVAS